MRMYSKVIRGVAIALCFLALLCGICLAYDVTHPQNPHNLAWWASKSPITFRTSQVCVFCHTPHGANTSVQSNTFWNSTGYQNDSGSGSFILWNRDIENSTGFTTYQSSTFQGGSGEIRVYSLMCMSCHDGVSAVNVMTRLPHEEPTFWFGETIYYTNPEGQLAVRPLIDGGNYKLGGTPADIGDRSGTVSDLSNDHPISFDYTSALATSDGGLVTPDAQGYVGDPAVKLFQNPNGDVVSMECSTCHDPHTYETGYRVPFLVISNQNSGLCLNCHLK